ncbi:Cys/Met metabolism PLP-dependent enzyme-domain-containing protein [Pisolithus tinctorius]|nr:Cys/Met metabolism PLP-dependent enzyme-domain-containing protein [Pisolithus tinctorius]
MSPLARCSPLRTKDVFENRVASLEGGVAVIGTSSGQSAPFLAISTIASAEDNIVSTSYLYGGVITFKNYGIGVKFLQDDDPVAFEAAIDEKTKAIYVESIGNPKYNVAPISDLAQVAHEHGIPLIVGNTFGMGNYLSRPISLGADNVVHSTTKWIDGHGTTIAGVVIDSGMTISQCLGILRDSPAHLSCKFDWTRKFHDPVLNEAYGSSVFAGKSRVDLMRDLGPSLNPFGAFLLIQGSETLSLRAQRHSNNALALATVLSFGVQDAIGVAGQLIDNLHLASNLTNVGDAKTLSVHPATTTHQQLMIDE